MKYIYTLSENRYNDLEVIAVFAEKKKAKEFLKKMVKSIENDSEENYEIERFLVRKSSRY